MDEKNAHRVQKSKQQNETNPKIVAINERRSQCYKCQNHERETPKLHRIDHKYHCRFTTFYLFIFLFLFIVFKARNMYIQGKTVTKYKRSFIYPIFRHFPRITNNNKEKETMRHTLATYNTHNYLFLLWSMQINIPAKKYTNKQNKTRQKKGTPSGE